MPKGRGSSHHRRLPFNFAHLRTGWILPRDIVKIVALKAQFEVLHKILSRNRIRLLLPTNCRNQTRAIEGDNVYGVYGLCEEILR